MRGAVLRAGQVIVDDIDDPVPQMGQVLVRTIACGICGSDLHFVKHGRRLLELSRDPAVSGATDGLSAGMVALDVDRDVFMGHEFSAEVLEVGPDTVGPADGTVVTSVPLMLTMEGVHPIAYSNLFPGGYCERMLLSAPMLLPIPNGLDPRHAALTEPMAVGSHAVAKSAITPRESALVLGCGPVGLAVIAGLRLAGVESIVASDFSPTRRTLASTLGATAVVDPASEPPISAWRAADGRRPLVIFEAVGVPGMLAAAMRDAPRDGRVLVVGVCMEPDAVQPFVGINKELTIQFALAYTPEEFARSLRAIAEGHIDVAPLITGTVGIEEVPVAFDELAHPDRHAKILVEP
jgi:threonine dehydrogenase-like Zn-dependent dehydrogenase